MIIQAKQLQQNIMELLTSRTQTKKMKLDIVYVGENTVIEKYIHAKQVLGIKLGVDVSIHRFTDDTLISTIKEKIHEISLSTNGILIQLPIPEHMKVAGIIECVDSSLDVDLLTHEAYGQFLAQKNKRLPPVVRACLYIIESQELSLLGKKICILGNGKLVGKPMADWCTIQGFPYDQLTKENFSLDVVKQADVIISGMGAPHFITEDMVKEGVIVFDAGTTEESGSILGDIHPDVAKKAALFTPVPGGIGPLTVVALFHNLIEPYES